MIFRYLNVYDTRVSQKGPRPNPRHPSVFYVTCWNKTTIEFDDFRGHQSSMNGEMSGVFCWGSKKAVIKILVLHAGNGWVAGGCWDDYYW